jgi:dynein heavy chain 1, cytosolic
MYEAIKPLKILDVDGLLGVWAHDASRLFQDQLVTEEEKLWTDKTVDESAISHFPTINTDRALSHPIHFSNWTSKYNIPVEREVIREDIKLY